MTVPELVANPTATATLTHWLGRKLERRSGSHAPEDAAEPSGGGPVP